MTVEQLVDELSRLVRDDPRFAWARVVLSVGQGREMPASYVEGFTDTATSERQVELS